MPDRLLWVFAKERTSNRYSVTIDLMLVLTKQQWFFWKLFIKFSSDKKWDWRFFKRSTTSPGSNYLRICKINSQITNISHSNTFDWTEQFQSASQLAPRWCVWLRRPRYSTEKVPQHSVLFYIKSTYKIWKLDVKDCSRKKKKKKFRQSSKF